MLIASCICILIGVLINQRSDSASPLIEAHGAMSEPCSAVKESPGVFIFLVDAEPDAVTGCADVSQRVLGELGFSEEAVAEAFDAESDSATRAGSFRLSSFTFVLPIEDSSIEIATVEVASCERVIVDFTSPRFKISQVLDRVWTSACDTDFGSKNPDG